MHRNFRLTMAKLGGFFELRGALEREVRGVNRRNGDQKG